MELLYTVMIAIVLEKAAQQTGSDDSLLQINIYIAVTTNVFGSFAYYGMSSNKN